MAGLQGTAPKIAIGAAVVALLVSAAAAVVVVSRGNGRPAAPSQAAEAAGSRRVAAADVTKLKRDIVEKVSEAGKVIGVKVTDAEVRAALGLGADDVITALSGRAIKREFDVYDAVLGMSMMDTSVVYVDLIRDKKPVLVRWQLDGELRSARRADTATSRSTGGALGNPFDINGGTGTPPDPLLATIKRLDDFSYEVPRSTVDRLLASSSTYSRGARIIPAFRGGQNQGFKLYAIRPDSVFAAAGFNNGDTVRAVNGHELDSPDDALEIYQQIKDEKVWRFEIVRRGKAEVLTITIN
jgi:S1-C subfamily serine protease